MLSSKFNSTPTRTIFGLPSTTRVCSPTGNDIPWLIFLVYNVSKYMDDHPGGKDILLEVAGTDATEAFEEVGHSDEAREQLEPFYIGALPTEVTPVDPCLELQASLLTAILGQEQSEVEVYRPNFEQVSQSAVVDVKNSPAQSSILRKLLKLGLAGLIGTITITCYRNGWTVDQTIRALSSSLSLSLPKGTPSQGASRNFWAGACIATIAQLPVTLGLGVWASSKLDVQQEFTNFKPHRPAQTAHLIQKPHTNIPRKRASVLDPPQWRPFTLARKEEVAPHVYRLVFALPKTDDVLGLPTGQHIALRATIEGQTVSRSYTPISNNNDLGRIVLFIKVYPNGAMTRYLENMAVGQSIDIRGPKGAMQYSHQYANHICMIAGGTGITPMYQLIRAICEDPQDTTRISLLYANNTENDILLRAELDAFARECPAKFQVHYVLSQPDTKWTGYRGFVNREMMEKHFAPATAENRALLCGPGVAGLGLDDARSCG